MITFVSVALTVLVMWCYMQHRLDCEYIFVRIATLKYGTYPDAKVIVKDFGFTVNYNERISATYIVAHRNGLLKRLEQSGVPVVYV